VWRLIAVLLTLVTDANVATRRVHITLDDGTTVFYRRGSNATQAASLTQNYAWAARLVRPRCAISSPLIRCRYSICPPAPASPP
jgi:hypothetical protein